MHIPVLVCYFLVGNSKGRVVVPIGREQTIWLQSSGYDSSSSETTKFAILGCVNLFRINCRNQLYLTGGSYCTVELMVVAPTQ